MNMYKVNGNADLCKQTALYILHVNTCTLSILHKKSTVL